MGTGALIYLITAMNNQLSYLKHQLVTEVNKYENLELQFIKLNEDFAKQEKENQDLQIQLSDLQRQLVNEDTKQKDLRNELIESNSKSEIYVQKNELLQDRMFKLDSDLSNEVKSSEEQSNELSSVKESVETTKKQLTDTNLQISIMQGKCF